MVGRDGEEARQGGEGLAAAAGPAALRRRQCPSPSPSLGSQQARPQRARRACLEDRRGGQGVGGRNHGGKEGAVRPVEAAVGKAQHKEDDWLGGLGGEGRCKRWLRGACPQHRGAGTTRPPCSTAQAPAPERAGWTGRQASAKCSRGVSMMAERVTMTKAISTACTHSCRRRRRRRSRGGEAARRHGPRHVPGRRALPLACCSRDAPRVRLPAAEQSVSSSSEGRTHL